MASRDPQVDAYIQKSGDFAKPILEYLRETVHSAAPPAEETIKWRMPFFMYDGRILCSMASLKAALTKSKKASAAFEKLSPNHRR